MIAERRNAEKARWRPEIQSSASRRKNRPRAHPSGDDRIKHGFAEYQTIFDTQRQPADFRILTVNSLSRA